MFVGCFGGGKADEKKCMNEFLGQAKLSFVLLQKENKNLNELLLGCQLPMIR